MYACVEYDDADADDDRYMHVNRIMMMDWHMHVNRIMMMDWHMHVCRMMM